MTAPRLPLASSDPWRMQTATALEPLTAEGDVLCPLDETVAASAFADAVAEGFRSIAIVLMHGWKRPEHEARLARLPETVLALAKDPAAAKAKAENARQIVLAKQREQFDTLRRALA